MARVTAPGGTIIIVTWCHRDLAPTEESLQPWEKELLNKICDSFYLPAWCSTAEYVKLLQSLSLQVISNLIILALHTLLQLYYMTNCERWKKSGRFIWYRQIINHNLPRKAAVSKWQHYCCQPNWVQKEEHGTLGAQNIYLTLQIKSKVDKKTKYFQTYFWVLVLIKLQLASTFDSSFKVVSCHWKTSIMYMWWQ